MSKIQAVFERLRAQGRKALIPFITAGDPDPALTVPLLHSLVLAGAFLAGVVLLGPQAWVPGAVLVAVAVAGSWPLLGRLHRFARRWLVVVPAGVVLHDHVVLAETLMVPRANVRRCGLALADTQAADLTGPTGGHAIEVTVG